MLIDKGMYGAAFVACVVVAIVWQAPAFYIGACGSLVCMVIDASLNPTN